MCTEQPPPSRYSKEDPGKPDCSVHVQLAFLEDFLVCSVERTGTRSPSWRAFAVSKYRRVRGAAVPLCASKAVIEALSARHRVGAGVALHGLPRQEERWSCTARDSPSPPSLFTSCTPLTPCTPPRRARCPCALLQPGNLPRPRPRSHCLALVSAHSTDRQPACPPACPPLRCR